MHLFVTSQSCLSETTVEQTELRHRKSMTAWQWSAVKLVVDERWFQRVKGLLNSEQSEAGCHSAGEITQFAQGLQFHLTDTFTGDIEQTTDFSQCVALIAV